LRGLMIRYPDTPWRREHNGFRRGIEWRKQIRYVIFQGGEFW
jgi:hypothetical protein